MHSRSLYVSVLVCLCAALGCRLQGGAGEENATTLDYYIDDVMERFEIPGLTIAVTRGEDVVYAGAFGVRSLTSGEPMSADNLFHMASVSKPFVATAVMQLVEQGRMNLDEPIVTYLPYFELADQRYREITVRQVLNHTSGMPDVDDYEWDNPQYDDGAAERYVRSLNNELMIAAPGERWQYSNMAFDKVYAEEGIDAAKALYRRLEAEATVDYVFGDGQLNTVGYYFLRENQVAQAIEVFEYNVALYPEVANTHDSLGEAYMLNGNNDLAIESYRRALEQDPNSENARERLRELGVR